MGVGEAETVAVWWRRRDQLVVLGIGIPKSKRRTHSSPLSKLSYSPATNGEGCLNSLRFLGIVRCKHLKCLFEGMQALTALRELKIGGSPKLSRRCRKEDGPKIAHVPVVELREDYGQICPYKFVKAPEDDEEVRTNLSSYTNYDEIRQYNGLNLTLIKLVLI